MGAIEGAKRRGAAGDSHEQVRLISARHGATGCRQNLLVISALESSERKFIVEQPGEGDKSRTCYV